MLLFKTKPKPIGWHKWFAWYPVFITVKNDNCAYAWFMYVERCYIKPISEYSFEYNYRLIRQIKE